MKKVQVKGIREKMPGFDMSLRSYGGLLRSSILRISAQRSVFVLSSERKRRAVTNKENLQRRAEREDLRKKRKENADIYHSFKELRKLTNDVSDYVQKRKTPENSTTSDSETAPRNKLADEQGTKDEKDNFDPKSSSLLTPATAIPTLLQDKIGPAVKYLVTKDHQNWYMALKQIEASGGFHNVTEVDIRKLVYNIPKNQLIIVFPQIERLLKDAGLQKSPKVVNAYLKGLISGGRVSDDRLNLMEHYVSEMRTVAKKGKLSRETYEILIEAYGKSKRIDLMERTINEMKEFGLQPTSNVYTSVLNTCVYKTRDHKQAVQLFDLMKFIAGSMAPGASQYQDIIVSYVNNNDIERALDLHEEMMTKSIPVNQKILVALAKGCMTRKQLRLKSWNFIFDIYKMKWEPTVPTLEYMIYLAAKDGDISLSRALYQQLNILGAVSPRAFGFLMLGYANCGLTMDLDKYSVPSILAHESGRNFRRNILERTDYTPHLSNPKRAVPFLPINSLTSANELLSESSAVMAHSLLVNPELVSVESVNMFLDIAAKLGSMNEFIDRYEQFTYFDRTGVPSTRTIETPIHDEGPYSEEVFDVETNELDEERKKEPNYTKSPVLNLEKEREIGLRFPRTTRTYETALRAAARNKNFEFSQTVWQERGHYRKSTTFRSLEPQERKKSDFRFAATMVKCLTDMALLDDALAILVSTEYQFRWTWKELKSLHTAAVNLGYDKVIKTVRGVARRAQENFEGKIKKKDFKRYVSERGY